MGDATLRELHEQLDAWRARGWANPTPTWYVDDARTVLALLEERGTVHPDARRADLMRRVVLEAHSLATGLARRQEPSAAEMHDAMHRIEQITWLLINRPEGLREGYAREDAAMSSAAQQEVKE